MIYLNRRNRKTIYLNLKRTITQEINVSILFTQIKLCKNNKIFIFPKELYYRLWVLE